MHSGQHRVYLRPDHNQGLADVYSLGISLWTMLIGQNPLVRILQCTHPKLDLTTPKADLLGLQLKQDLVSVARCHGMMHGTCWMARPKGAQAVFTLSAMTSLCACLCSNVQHCFESRQETPSQQTAWVVPNLDASLVSSQAHELSQHCLDVLQPAMDCSLQAALSLPVAFTPPPPPPTQRGAQTPMQDWPEGVTTS